MKWKLISPTVSSRLAVFPGDEVFRRNVLMDMKTGNNITLSSISTTVHIGAHTDAPSHYAKDGQTMEERSLEFYYGPCQVFRIENLKRGERILPQHLGQIGRAHV